MKDDMAGQTSLDDALRRLADEDRRVSAPPRVERAVMQAWDAVQPTAARQRRRSLTATAALGAAAAAAAALLAIASLNRPDEAIVEPSEDAVATASPPRPARVAEAPARADAQSVGQHPDARARSGLRGARAAAPVVLVADPMLDAAAATVVRVRVPRSALASLGIPLVEPDSTGAVDLDVVVGEDGIARSIQRAVPVGAPALQE